MNDANKIASNDYLETEEMEIEFLKAITHTTPLKKVFVHFKFKKNPIEYHDWITNREYLVLSKMKCVEFCNILA